MNATDWFQLGVALLLVILAGVMAAGEAALSSFSRARADLQALVLSAQTG